VPEAVVTDEFPPLEYIGEEDLNTYEGWLKYQAFDLTNLTKDEAAAVRELFDDAVRARLTARKVGRMKLKRPGESTYAIAIRDGAGLWLALWIKRSAKFEYFIFHPTSDGSWNPHSSLHKDGTFHMKSHDKVMLEPRRKQPPSAVKGTEHLGAYGGFGPKAVGAICDPADFTGIFEAPPLVLWPRNGMVTVDLMEPGSGAEPLMHPAEEVARHCFNDSDPHVLVRIFRT
jgi:hypothetical protein